MEIHIKNMVCDRCKMVVKDVLEALSLHPESVELGVVQLAEPPAEGQLATLKQRLHAVGFELLDDPRRLLVEQVKTAVIALVHHHRDDHHIKHSEYLVQQVGRDYPTLSKLFSEEEGLTLEQYIIRQKIERVKELMTYGELTLSEIAWQMGYSSVAAISAQFKKVTGTTPSAYKAAAQKERQALDRVGKG